MKKKINQITNKYAVRVIPLVFIFALLPKESWLSVFAALAWIIVAYFCLREIGGLIKNNYTRKWYIIGVSVVFIEIIFTIVVLKLFEKSNADEFITPYSLIILLFTLSVSLFCVARTMKISESLVPFFLYIIAGLLVIFNVAFNVSRLNG